MSQTWVAASCRARIGIQLEFHRRKLYNADVTLENLCLHPKRGLVAIDLQWTMQMDPSFGGKIPRSFHRDKMPGITVWASPTAIGIAGHV